MTHPPLVWRGHRTALCHAYYDVVPGVAERIVTSRIEASTGEQLRRARCGAWVRAEDLTGSNGGRRCKVCERAVEKAQHAPWADDAARPEVGGELRATAPELLARRMLGAPLAEITRLLEVDRRQTLEAAAALARDVAREHAARIEGAPDYLRHAMEQAAVSAALEVAARLTRANKPRRAPLRLVHTAARVA